MSRFRNVPVFFLGILMIALTTMVPAQSANAASSILISDDGVTFSTTYPGVLFDDIVHVVPGDTQTAVFYLRNTGPDDGYVRLTVRDVTGDSVLLKALTLSAGPPARPGSEIQLSKAEPCWVLNEAIPLPSGATTRITTQLKFTAPAGNATQNSVADFDLGVQLSDAAVPLPPTECGGSDIDVPGALPAPYPDADDLPPTGGEVPIGLISVMAFLIGVGAFLIVATRRRKNREHGEEAED